MQQQQRKGLRRIWIFTFLLAVVVAVLFWLEWLGSEQPVKVIEQPVPVPQSAADSN